MEIKACQKCGKIFQYITGAPICMDCKKQEEELFQEVKAYLRENRGATMEEICEATGATVKMLSRYLKEGRLEVTTDSAISLNCEKCGAKIYTGRLCESCRARFNARLSEAAQSLQNKQADAKARMRFLNSYNNKE